MHAPAPPRWRHLNHPSADGPDVPILYSAVKVGGRGNVVAVGRDLRATAALQQRLIDAQQSMERDYSRLRHVETRYRLLFQVTSEAVMIVDAATQKVVGGQPGGGAAARRAVKRIVGRSFPEGFDVESTARMCRRC